MNTGILVLYQGKDVEVTLKSKGYRVVGRVKWAGDNYLYLENITEPMGWDTVHISGDDVSTIRARNHSDNDDISDKLEKIESGWTK